MKVVTGNKEFFKGIGQVKYEGTGSDNPLSYRWYDENKVVAGKTMKEHLRFACAYWHSFVGNGADPFGEATHLFPWNEKTDAVERAKDKADAAFEFITKLGLPYYCFHDVDAVDYGNDVKENDRRLKAITEYLGEKQKASGVKLLWGTANLFSSRRYMNGAATNPDFHVLAHAGAQVKAALDATIALGGENYVFWGGREGYMTLLNTNMKREQEHLAKFLHLAVAHKKSIGFKGQFYIEPKPKEPTKHQYDSDAAACLNFLREFDLLPHFKLNIEANHATLAGHTMQHELEVAGSAGALGSIDANTGDELLGWDTDQFPTNIYLAAHTMLAVLKFGGFKTGGVNFDAKVRRESFEPIDLFYAHIGGMDAFARGLKIASAIRNDGRLAQFVKQRYASWDSGIGAKIESGMASMKEIEAYILKKGEVERNASGRQEFLENLMNEFI